MAWCAVSVETLFRSRGKFPRYSVHSASVALYVHIPFCGKRCPYCAFYKLIWNPEDERRYVDAVIEEMAIYARSFGGIPLSSVFWGGGTPSALSLDAISAIADGIRTHFTVPDGIEWTVEANPETLTDDRLGRFSAHGINRVSVGIQSTLASELVTLGREHTQLSMDRLLDRIRSVGIDNINVDFIYGVPGQTLLGLLESIEWALHQRPTHISTYALSIEPGTIYAKTGVKAADEDLQLQMYRGIRRRVLQAGFRQYEVSAFGLPGYESRHNLSYWHYSPYIGLGPSASSYFKGVAYHQVSSLERYVLDPTPPVLKGAVALDTEGLGAHFLIANLRRSEGVTYSTIERELGAARWMPMDPAVKEFKRMGLLRNRDDRLQLTRRGVELMNTVLEGLI